MEETIKALEDTIIRDRDCHQELIECLKIERQALIGADVDAIMKLACKKQSLAESILENRIQVELLWQKVFPGKGVEVSISHIDKVVQGGNPGIFGKIRETLLELNDLKDVARELTGTNRAIAEDSLCFLRELFSAILVGEPGKPPAYGRNGEVQRSSESNLIMSQEV